MISTATIFGRLTVTDALADLDYRVLPAQDAATELVKAYVDQETGQRGFLLTGDPQFLQPYADGEAAVSALLAQLSTLLSDDPGARSALAEVTSAATAWRVRAAEPEIAARRAGAIAQTRMAAYVVNGKQLFDVLRQRLSALQASTTQLTNAALHRISTAQEAANIVTSAALALAVTVAIGFVPVLRRSLSRPMNRLVEQVRLAANGGYDGPIDVGGPREIATVAQAVTTMRDGLVNSAHELVDAQHELTLSTEQTRVATELQSLTSQRVFALGLALSSAATRPNRNLDLQPFIDETDNIVRDLRSIAFDLDRHEVVGGIRAIATQAVAASTATLGFRPAVEFAGPVDLFSALPVHAELIRILGEALDNVAERGSATEVTVRITATHDRLRLTIADDAAPRSAEPRTTVEWRVPSGTDPPPDE